MIKYLNLILGLTFILRADVSQNPEALLDSALSQMHSNPQKALNFGYQILENDGVVPDTIIASTQMTIGAILNEQGLPTQALEYYVSSLEIYSRIEHYSSRVGWHLIDMGNIYFHQGLYEDAVEKYQSAFEKFQQIDLLYAQATALNNLGLVSIAKGEYDEAMSLFFKALDIRQRYENEPYLILHSYKYIGDLYDLQGNDEKAMDFYQKIIQMNISSGEGNIKGLSYESIGDIYVKFGDTDRALTNYINAEKDFTQDLNPKYLVLLYLKIADIYQEIQADSAQVYLKKALKQAEQYGLIGLSIATLEKIIAYYESLNESERTLPYYRQLDKLRQTRFDAELSKSIRKVEAQLELSEHKNKLEEKEARLGQITIMRNIAVIIIFLLVISLWSFYRYYLHKKKTNRLLAQQQEDIHQKELDLEHLKVEQAENEFKIKKQELVSKIMFLQQKNDETSNVQKKLKKSIKQVKTKKKREQLDSAISALEDMEKSNTGWREYEEKCLTQYPELYQTLSEKYPNLTTMDKRICAYVLIDLETKEMAMLIGKTVRAAENIRFRLRKKMDIPKMYSLMEFLHKIVEAPNEKVQ